MCRVFSETHNAFFPIFSKLHFLCEVEQKHKNEKLHRKWKTKTLEMEVGVVYVIFMKNIYYFYYNYMILREKCRNE